MKIAFDARAWEKPPHSFRRVLQILFGAARAMDWEVELWINRGLQPEFTKFNKLARLVREGLENTSAAVLWAPQLDTLPVPVPVVATIHDVNPLMPDGRRVAVRWWRGFRFRHRVRRRFRRAWRVAIDSEDARQRVSAEFPAYAHKLAVVPLYSDPGLRRIDDTERDSRLSSLGLSSGYILFVGSMRRHKNWNGLMRAYAALPLSARSEHALVLAGPIHRALDRAERLATFLGVRDQVHVLGEVAEKFMSALYSGAFMFVFPTFMEGFGLPPLEAMSCGVPVIASNVTSVPEVLGDAPMYIDPFDEAGITDAMGTLIEDEKLREQLIQSGLRRVAEFGPERTGAAMRALLADI